jgi:putative sigma-54 modulation protein
MKIHVTCRHFKGHDTLSEYAERTVGELERFYDGIIKADVILSYEKARNSIKIAEVSLSVFNATLTGVGKSEDFFKSMDAATSKVLIQLKKYKEKLHSKDRKQVRRIREKA